MTVVSRVLFALTLAGCGMSFDDPAPTDFADNLPVHIFPTPTQPAVVTETKSVCDWSKPGAHCHAIVATENGAVKGFATPNGFGPTDLQSAYNIDTTLGTGITVAIVDAYGYQTLESDLAMYRSTFGLPPCTTANGCLKIVNDSGNPSPLPPEPPANDDWTEETALDIDMVSAACPLCNILVIQTSSDGQGLFAGQMAAGKLGATVISNSWGLNEGGGELQLEGNFDVPGVTTFASTGDDGNNGGMPQYPATSAHVIAVGGTHLQMVDPSVDPRGWVETAWSLAGSSCSNNIPKPAFQTAATACQMRAAADISAVADPSTGVAIFASDNGNPGWAVIGGTSASSPLVAAMFAAAGHGDTNAGFVYKHSSAFLDVKLGQNGPCGAPLCSAGPGWDGPTGLGSVDQGAVAAITGTGTGPGITITFPTDGATVQPGFTIETTSGTNMLYMTVLVDGMKAGASSKSPFDLSSSTTLTNGMHTIEAQAFDIDHNMSTMSIMVDVEPDTGGDDTGGGGGGCCSTGGSGGSSVLLSIGLGALVLRRRRR